jgi:radical SAM protein with 4Fe4S-binding SPASM domain
MIAIPQNMHEIPALLDKWRGVVDYVGVGGYTNRAGSLDEQHIWDAPTPDAGGEASTPAQPPAHHCVLPFRDLNIWADGRAVLCCDDWNEEHVVGDLNSQSLSEIWRGEALRHARSLHKLGRGNELEICSRCNMWRQAPGARLWS